MKDRRILITCSIIILLVCLLVACISFLGAGIYFWDSVSYKIGNVPEDILNTQEEPLTLPEVDDENESNLSDQKIDDEESTLNDTDVDSKITSQMDEIQIQVILERGLKPSENVNRMFYTPSQLKEKIKDDFDAEYSPEEAQMDAIVLSSFGLIESDFDLYNFQIDLLSEQIGGFYDQKTGEMVVISEDSFGGIERFTYAHEYIHALQDQNYDIENGLNFNDDFCEDESERCTAVRALLEGDATLGQFNWFTANATPKDQADIIASINETDMPVFDSAPEFFTQNLLFPYEYGYAFVQQLFNIGGWGTVDRAYHNLPVSTEQIMHPKSYPDEKPIQVNLPGINDVLGSGWEEIDRGVMGEWSTYLILTKGLDINGRIHDRTAAKAAEGWGGDAYIVYYNAETSDTVMVLQTTWDSPAEAEEFAESFRDYANGRFGKSSNDTWQDEDGYHIFKHQTASTTWIYAPDLERATTVWKTIDS